jgi:hypothetical protein
VTKRLFIQATSFSIRIKIPSFGTASGGPSRMSRLFMWIVCRLPASFVLVESRGTLQWLQLKTGPGWKLDRAGSKC